jgi:hypothetical protein
LLTHQFWGAGEGSMLTDPRASLVEKIRFVQVVVLAGTVVRVVGGAAVVVGATDFVTGTAVAGGSPRGGVVVVDAATW